MRKCALLNDFGVTESTKFTVNANLSGVCGQVPHKIRLRQYRSDLNFDPQFHTADIPIRSELTLIKATTRPSILQLHHPATMKASIHKLLLSLVLLLPFALANGAVNLSFDNSALPITPGGTFNVTLSIQLTAGEQVTGVNYYLQELSAAGFYIIDRVNNQNSGQNPVAFAPFFTDAEVESSGDAVLPAGADNALAGGTGAQTGRNDYDLGGTTQSTSSPNTTGGVVASFTIGVPNTVTPGQQFTISTTSNAGTGWSGPGPSFTDHSFDSNASILLTVVPEPATWSLLGLGALGAFGVNLLRSRVRR